MDVVAAIILHEARFLVARRPAHKARPLLWEFPGGKVEPGETHAQALLRECQEELGITIRVGRLYTQVEHAYPDITVNLFVYLATLSGGEPRALEGQELAWVTASETANHVFCPADTDILERLRKEHGQYADLHLHSQHSDGTLTPEEIVAQASALGIGYLALSDHNSLDGLPPARAACRKVGVRFLPGVELNALDDGHDVHTLAYGFDENDAAFAGYVRANRARLDGLSTRLIALMQADGHPVSLADYERFIPDPRVGGWKAMQYLPARGLGSGMWEVLGWYTRYGCSFDTGQFPSVPDTIDIIHRAHAKAVLAHPRESLERGKKTDFPAWLDRMMAYGFDGIECYHPSQSDADIRFCVDLCRARGLIITAGSDAHGAFSAAQMGELRTTIGDLTMGGLVFEQPDA